MDLQKTGKFIKELRKEKSLTQTDLAQKLCISEKTISKWECGNGFPDTSLILPLCEALDITSNELLSGKKLSSSEYKTEAEKNLCILKSQQEKSTKFLLMLEIVIGFIVSANLLFLVLLSSFAMLPAWLRICLIIFGFIQFVVGISFAVAIEKDAGFYECAHCHHKYIPTYNSVLWSMHVNRTRYMKCPKCNKKSWQKKVIN